MNRTSLVLLSMLVAAPGSLGVAENLVPAGSLIQCTVSEPKVSSKTEAIGDPVSCKISSAVSFGRSSLPYNSFMIGQFEDYKDPGHLVGKGWMELKFERMVIQPDMVIPMETKVVAVPGYQIDREGRIHGKGHPVRDTVEWAIPILWPIDLINLPKRGPRPTLKTETRLTLKVMDDVMVPSTQPPAQDPYGLLRRSPSAYSVPQRVPSTVPHPIALAETSGVLQLLDNTSTYKISPAPPSHPGDHFRTPYTGSPDQPEAVTLVYNDGRPPEQIHNYVLTPTRIYVMDSSRHVVPVDELDLEATQQVNREAGVDFRWLNRSR